MLAYHSYYEAKKSRQRELEAAYTFYSVLPLFHSCRIPFKEWCHSVWGLLTFSKVKIICHKHAQRSPPQVILDLVQLTNNTNHIPFQRISLSQLEVQSQSIGRTGDVSWRAYFHEWRPYMPNPSSRVLGNSKSMTILSEADGVLSPLHSAIQLLSPSNARVLFFK